MDEILPPHDGGCSRNFITWYHPEAKPHFGFIVFCCWFFFVLLCAKGKRKKLREFGSFLVVNIFDGYY